MTDDTWRAIGERLREARSVRGLGQQELGAKLNLDRTAVAKLESGQRRMTALELVSASEVLRVPMSWLATGPAPAMVSRRRSAVEDRPGAFGLDVALHEAWEQVELLSTSGHLAAAPLPFEVAMDCLGSAANAATEVRRHLGLSASGPLGGMAGVAARLGLHITVIDASGDGASMTPEAGLGAAVLGGRVDPGRRRFTCAHEIGHHILGDEYSADGSIGDSRDEREQLIDTFATELLLPSDVRTARTRADMVRLAGTYRVSWSMALRACGFPDVGPAPRKAEFVEVGIDVPEDLRIGYRSMVWRQAVLEARAHHDLTDAAAVDLLGEPVMSADDLPPLEEPGW